MPVLKSIARTALHRAGGLSLVRSLNRNGLRILMFHSYGMAGPELQASLEQSCAHIRRYYQPVSLGEVARAWKSGQPLPPNAVVITVDDGYRDFYELAYPVYSAYRIPATIYLVTEFMDGRLWLWPDRLRYAATNARAGHISTRLPSGERVFLPLDSEAAREHAASTLREELKRVPNEARLQFLEEMPALFEVCIPERPTAEYAPLTWDSVREMAANGVEFGAHTRTHPILSRLADDTCLRHEIEGSKHRIEEELGRPVLHFCYPNGRAEDINDKVVDCVRQAGFETAAVTTPGLNFPGADLFRLNRLPADPGYPEYYFEEIVAGVHHR